MVRLAFHEDDLGFIEVLDAGMQPPISIDVALFIPKDSKGFNQIPELILSAVVFFHFPVCDLSAINHDLKGCMLFD